MTEGNASSSNPDVPTDYPENNSELETKQGGSSDHVNNYDADTSAMARALKYELEQKDMDVKVDDDGETIIAEKFDKTYRISPDGTVDGTGVLTDGIENIIEELDVGHGTGVEPQSAVVESDSEFGPDDSGAYSEDEPEKDGTDRSSEEPKTPSNSDDEHHATREVDETKTSSNSISIMTQPDGTVSRNQPMHRPHLNHAQCSHP